MWEFIFGLAVGVVLTAVLVTWGAAMSEHRQEMKDAKEGKKIIG